jgi:hypothetical protein
MSKGMRGIAKQEKRKKQDKVKPADLIHRGLHQIKKTQFNTTRTQPYPVNTRECGAKRRVISAS